MDDDAGRRADPKTLAEGVRGRDRAGTATATPSEAARRRFLLGTGAIGAAAALRPDWIFAANVLVIPNAEGFLVVDMKKCQGCSTCMMACSLAHAGKASYNLSRIQIQQDSWANWPDDIFMAHVPPVRERTVRRRLPGRADQGEQAESRRSATCG